VELELPSIQPWQQLVDASLIRQSRKKKNPQITRITQIKNRCRMLLDGVDFLILLVRICEI